MRLMILLAVVLATAACNTAGYLWHMSTGQLAILLSQRPLAESLRDRRIPLEHREKLALIPSVKKFGVEHLGLEGSRSYETFVNLDRGYATLVLSAAPPDSLDAYRWSFPIVGTMAYKGFFDRGMAERERERFAGDGFDVFLRPASAFSTLGWFNDPILSTMLAMDEADLANTILHEMAHATLYFANHTEFNETVATFLGNQGAIVYLTARYGADASEVTAAAADIEDQARFAGFIRETIAGLREIYGGGYTRDEKLHRKAEYLELRKREFDDSVLTNFRYPTRFARFTQSVWNNASLLARNAYYGDLELFGRLYAKRGGSLREFIEYLRTWSDEEDPRLRLLAESEDMPG